MATTCEGAREKKCDIAGKEGQGKQKKLSQYAGTTRCRPATGRRRSRATLNVACRRLVWTTPHQPSLRVGSHLRVPLTVAASDAACAVGPGPMLTGSTVPQGDAGQQYWQLQEQCIVADIRSAQCVATLRFRPTL